MGSNYVYSDLPKIVGIEPIGQIIILWKEEIDIKQCLFSRLVLCRELPVPVSLAKSSCLSQLLDNTQSNTSKCQVIRSRNIEKDFMQIDNGLWLLFHIHHSEKCHIYSSFDNTIESISINEPVLISMPCNKSVMCIGFQIPTTPCASRRTLVASYFPLHSQPQSRIFLPIRNMTKTIISSYETQFRTIVNELLTALSSKKPNFKQVFEIS